MATDPVKLITADHRKVEQIFEKLLSGGRPEPGLVDQLVAELSLHATIEEQIVYPAATDALDDGRELVKEATQEHAEAKKLLAQIERKKGQEGPLRELIARLRDDVEHHVEEEESELLPKLEKSLDRASLTTMANQIERAKGRAGAASGGAPTKETLLDLTREELYEQAKQAGIEGRSKMSKRELADALSSQ